MIVRVCHVFGCSEFQFCFGAHHLTNVLDQGFNMPDQLVHKNLSFLTAVFDGKAG